MYKKSACGEHNCLEHGYILINKEEKKDEKATLTVNGFEHAEKIETGYITVN